MKDYMSISTPEYDLHFWNALRGRNYNPAFLSKGATSETGIHLLPASDGGKFLTYLKAESLFRRIGTVITVGIGDHHILAKDCKDMAGWYDEGESIPVYEGIRDFTVLGLGSRKLASFIKFDEEFARDAVFDFNDYLLRRFARVMAGRKSRHLSPERPLRSPTVC